MAVNNKCQIQAEEAKFCTFISIFVPIIESATFFSYANVAMKYHSMMVSNPQVFWLIWLKKLNKLEV